MPWVRLDDHFDEHPKLAEAGPLGLALWVAGMVMMVGLPLALLSSLLTPLVPLVSWAMTIPVAWVAGVARICSEVSPHGGLNVALWLCVAGAIWHRWRQTEA